MVRCRTSERPLGCLPLVWPLERSSPLSQRDPCNVSALYTRLYTGGQVNTTWCVQLAALMHVHSWNTTVWPEETNTNTIRLHAQALASVLAVYTGAMPQLQIALLHFADLQPVIIKLNYSESFLESDIYIWLAILSNILPFCYFESINRLLESLY